MSTRAPGAPVATEDAKRRARRTALVVGLVALAVYAAFLLSGFLGAL